MCGASANSRAAVHSLCALLRRSRAPLTRAMSQQNPTTALKTAAPVIQAAAARNGRVAVRWCCVRGWVESGGWTVAHLEGW